jgi:hypothetical protein
MEVLRTAIVLALVGAGSITTGHAETRPLTDAEKKIITSAHGSDLKDPQSAQYRWADLIIEPSAKGAEFAYCFQVNAKNSYGGYTGFRTIGGKVTHHNGKILSYSYLSGGNENPAMTADNICRAFGYTFRP